MIKIDVWKNVLRILDSYLEMNNHRKTPERYTILKAIYNSEGHFTLEELGDKLIRDYNFPVSRATLYNTLNLFREIRLVVSHHIEGITKYEAFYGNNKHCHQVCTSCGKVKEVRDTNFAAFMNARRFNAFNADHYCLYVYGTCSTCARKKKRSRST